MALCDEMNSVHCLVNSGPSNFHNSCIIIYYEHALTLTNVVGDSENTLTDQHWSAAK